MKSSRLLVVALVLSAALSAGFARPVQAASTLIKGSGPAVYFVADDGKRYVFPDAPTYFSWYPDFNGVRGVSDAEMSSIPFGGVVTMRPGVKLVKIKTDPRVYAVARFGTLRWLTNEAIAKMIYGDAWIKNIVDLPDAQFANYRVCGNVTGPGQYWWKLERDNALSINADIRPRLAALPAASGVVLASAPTTGQLRFQATIVNGGNFNSTDSDIRLFVENLRVDNDKAVTLPPGDYTVYRTGLQGYEISDWGGDCSPQGYVHIQAGDLKTCTVGYAYSAEAARLPRLKIIHAIKNDDPNNGAIPGDFTMFIDGMVVKNDAYYDVSPGVRKLVISTRYGYTTYPWAGDCNADGTIYLELGEEKTCTVFSDDNDKNAGFDSMGELVLIASVVNDNGGVASASDVKLFIEGLQVPSGKVNPVDPRSYTVYASGPAGYAASPWGGDCTPQGTVGLTVNQYKVCTITFNDN